LILGYVVYIIWGLLLHYELSHPYIKPESEQIKLMHENIERKLTSRKEELASIKANIVKLDNEITTCNNKIEDKTQSLTAYKTGTVPVNIPELEAFVGEFMGGWNYYIKGYYDDDKANKLMETANQSKDEWINHKKQSLKTPN
jgi:seryl-tRNA synthetase